MVILMLLQWFSIIDNDFESPPNWPEGGIEYRGKPKPFVTIVIQLALPYVFVLQSSDTGFTQIPLDSIVLAEHC